MKVVIIGSGLSGLLVAKNLHDQKFSGSVSVITQERGVFYSKPSLSNVVKQGKKVKDLVQMTQQQIEKDWGCEMITRQQVARIDKINKLVHLKDTQVPYDRLVLALGASPICYDWLPDSHPVYRVNDLDAYDTFHQAIDDKSHLLILGGGLIGCEFAHDLSAIAGKITLLESESTLLSRFVPKEIGMGMALALKDRGVDVKVNCAVSAVTALKDSVCVRTQSEEISADVMLACLGLSPNIKLAQEAGIICDDAINVDVYGQTSDPSIYALGDCASVSGIKRYYVSSLKICADTIAKHICGVKQGIVYPPLPVGVKTPDYPVTFCYSEVPAEWRVERHDKGVRAVAYQGDELVGFALSGDFIKEREVLKGQMKNWI
ncbi:FAD-dependent oxidoreductase [Candidatus Comchoanobacter bicostacola]|uniref:FAD-dependent oxidoreductase n=1 Tax=Candidatus Comchoanobacter bicostacola TaxID=2919598 RepID=A0ABY5DJD7_9GAMM|nr:FAD-dependent oxidoreductase [Candidatus Comchoanobacter bicostacola]UTC24426.1 FAD-dependent oxidoreductase [Candidatus Comchoanobacter bicostacola]